MKTRKYFLDFDGVICDSRAECMITSYNAYRTVFFGSTRDCFEEKVIPEKDRELFVAYRYLVRIAEEYKLLWDLIFSKKVISKDLPIYLQTKSDKESLDLFKKTYFEKRYLWMNHDLESWLMHNKLFDGIFEKVKDLNSNNLISIVSAKDEKSIRTILEFNEIHVPEKSIYGNEYGDKNDILKKIIEFQDRQDIVFIDDNLDNVLTAKGFGIPSYLASWGYLSDGTLRNAEKEQVTVIDIEDFVRFHP